MPYIRPFVSLGNRLTIAGIAVFAVALESVILLVVTYVLSRGAGIAAAAALAGLVLVFWYGLPAAAAIRDRKSK